MGNKTSITGFIGTLFVKSDGTNVLTNMSEAGAALADGQVYLDLRSANTEATANGGALMAYNATKAAWYGVLLTTSTSTTTSTTTSTSTSTTTTTSTSGS